LVRELNRVAQPGQRGAQRVGRLREQRHRIPENIVGYSCCAAGSAWRAACRATARAAPPNTRRCSRRSVCCSGRESCRAARRSGSAAAGSLPTGEATVDCAAPARERTRSAKRRARRRRSPSRRARGARRRSDESSRYEAHAVRTSISGLRSDNTTTPATAVTAAESGDQTNSCIASSAPLARWLTSRKIRSNSHLARKRKKPLSARLSAKKTALSQEAAKPTTDIARAAAPKALTDSESDTRPNKKPYRAAVPGRKRTEPMSSATTRKSIDARQASSGRSV